MICGVEPSLQELFKAFLTGTHSCVGCSDVFGGNQSCQSFHSICARFAGMNCRMKTQICAACAAVWQVGGMKT